MSGLSARLVRKLRSVIGVPRTYEESLVGALVRPGDTVLDVGAHVGSLSLYLSRIAGPAGKVYAFEPIAPIYELLCVNLRHLRRHDAPVIPQQFGFSDVCATATLQVPAGRFGFASLASATAWSSAVGEHRLESFACRFMTVDTFLQERPALEPDFVKIDVEGAELLVLKGATGMLSRRRPPLMYIEIFAPWERAFGYSPWEVLGLLARDKYEFLYVCPRGVVAHSPTEASPFPPEYEQGYNVIAHIPALHADRIRSLDRLRYDAARRPYKMEAPIVPNRIAASGDRLTCS